MTAAELVSTIEASGGLLTVNGNRLRYELPEEAAPLLPELRAHRDAVLRFLRERSRVPAMPSGVRLVSWQPKAPPVILTSYSVVIDIEKFIEYTLEQLGHALKGENWLAANWTVRELMERLEQAGVVVEVGDKNSNLTAPPARTQ